MELSALGWSEFFATEFSRLSGEGWVPARVVTEDKGYYTVVGTDGPLLAVIAGKLLHRRESNATLPKVGDWVAITPQTAEGKATIHHVLPRRSTLTRKLTGRETAGQVLATNVDTAFVVQALDSTFNLRRLERFLVMIHEGGATPVVLLNKSDLCDAADARLAEAQLAAGPDVPVLVVSAKTRRGMGELRRLIHPGATVVFLGTSGVGKSSLINRLYGDEVMPTIEVRESDSKGRHTTTTRELIQLPCGGLVIDTPGMREFHMWLADEGIDTAFPDVSGLGTRCKFRDCRHEQEPGCAVRAAAEAGTLPRERYQSFLKLQRELADVAESRKQHNYMVRKRRAKLGTKAWLRND
jgi:ribosome biogenesis GTPase